MLTQCPECGGQNGLHVYQCSKAPGVRQGAQSAAFAAPYGNQQASDRNGPHRSMPRMPEGQRSHEYEKLFQEWWAGFHDPNVGHMEHSIQRHAARSLMNYLFAKFKPSDN